MSFVVVQIVVWLCLIFRTSLRMSFLLWRRTTRKFTEQALTQEEVVDLMKVPLLAPSSRNRQPLQYILVDNKDDLSRLSECKPSGAQPLKHAALAVVVLADSNLSDTWIEDASIASSMILLQAQALNLGACWIQIRLRSFPDGTSAAEIVRSILNIPDDINVLSIIAIGHKAAELPAYNDKDLKWEKVHVDKF